MPVSLGHLVRILAHGPQRARCRPLNLLPPTGARTDTAEYAEVDLDPGPNGAAFEQCLEDPEWAVLATVGAYDNGLPALAALSPAIPAAVARLPHHLPDIGDDRRQNSPVAKAFAPSEPPCGLIDIFQAVDAAVELQPARQLLDQLRNRVDEASPIGEARSQRVLAPVRFLGN